MVRVRVGSQVGSSWPAKNTGRVTDQPVFASGKKKKNSSSSRVKKFWPVVPCLVVVVSYYGGSFVLWWIGGVGCCSSHFDLVIYGLLWLVWWLDLLSSLQSVVAGICGEERGDK